jgi:alkylation response protein AidB-like acyl-CoA dehydrogenase
VISGAVQYVNERIQFNAIAQFGAVRSKLAEMATSCYAGESASYRAAKDIEDRIIAREAEGISHQEAELKGLKNMLSECSVLKVAVSEDTKLC